MTSVTALEWTARVAGLGIAVSSAELLVSADWMFASGLITVPRRARMTETIHGAPAFRGLVALRLLAGLAMVVMPGMGGPLVPGVLLLGLIAQQVRLEAGLMAAEQIQAMTLAGQAAGWLTGSEPMRMAGLGFIALHAAIAYGAAGYHKLVSPGWRDGSAIRSIFNTRSYGNQWASGVLSKSPLTCRIAAWGVITWECLFPLAFVSPESAAVFTASGILFHLGTAVGMKLTGFLWAFPACYPAVLFWATR